METHYSHSSYPRVDDLFFYLSYHAMMVVAGKLLATIPVHYDPDDNGTRPFEELEPLLQTIESLNPEDDTPRYFRSLRADVGKTEKKDETKSWLNLIDGLDYSAKILIRYCLIQDKSAEWVALAEAADVDEGIEFPLIHMILDEDSMSKESDPDAQAKKHIEDRVERLENFAKLALEVASDLRQKV